MDTPDWQTLCRISIGISKRSTSTNAWAALDSGYQGVYYNIGVMQARLTRYDDAISSLLKQRQNADDADNEKLLADVYDAKGMKGEAAEARRKAAQLQAAQ
jgi:tetratricopeptide (TPR) repeat protein